MSAEAVTRQAGHVFKLPGVGYFVKSRSEPGWWLVAGNDCSGPHCEGRVCWHVRQTFEFEKALSTPRPSAPPNVSALVD